MNVASTPKTNTDRLSTSPNFTMHGVTWRCWITDEGGRYEWRSTCGRFRAGRSLAAADPSAFPPGKAPTFVAVHWARAGDRIVGKKYRTLREAMAAAIAALGAK